MKAIVILCASLCLCMASCEFAYAGPYTTTVTAPAPSPDPVLAIAPTAPEAPAKAIPEAPAAVPLAKAAPSPDMPWQMQLVYYVLAFLGALLTALTPVVVKLIVAKLKLDISEKQVATYDDLAVKAIQLMEERARQVIKASQPPMKSNEKLDAAVMLVLKQADAMGLPQKGVDEIVKLVESHLGAVADRQ